MNANRLAPRTRTGAAASLLLLLAFVASPSRKAASAAGRWMAVFLLAGFWLSGSGVAGPLYWDNAGLPGAWDDGITTNWGAHGGPYNTSPWIGGSDAHFEGTAGTVAVADSGIASVRSISFDVPGYTLGDPGGGLGPITLTGSALVTAPTGTQEIKSPILGANGLTKDGAGTVTLSGLNLYAGTTTVNAGTLRIDAGAGGSLDNNPLTINSGGTFAYDNTTAAGATSQTLAALRGYRDTTLRLTRTAAQNVTLTINSRPLGTNENGNTVNFVVSDAAGGGVNGTDYKIVLADQTLFRLTTGEHGYYFNGDFAVYDTLGGYVRGVNYGMDPKTGTYAAGQTIPATGINMAQVTGNISGQTSATLGAATDGQDNGTLSIVGASNITLETGASFTINNANDRGSKGILKSGGGTSVISGGAYLIQTQKNGIVRVDGPTDVLDIAMPYSPSDRQRFMKSGSGKLIFSSSVPFSGWGVWLNGGVIEIGGAATLTASDAMKTVPGAVLSYNSTSLTSVYSGSISGGGSLAVNSGMLALSAANSYTGPTLVNGGTLALGAAGSINGSPSITIAGGASFDVSAIADYHLLSTQSLRGGAVASAATVLGAVTADAGSTIAPGTAAEVGTLTFSGGLTLAGDGNLSFRIGSTANDKIAMVLTPLNASGTTPIALSAVGLTGPGTFTLIKDIAGGTWSAGSFSIPATLGAYTTSLDDSSGDTLRLVLVGAVTNEWKGPAGGDWNLAGNWMAGIPNGNTATANLWARITANSAVDLQAADQIVKVLSFKQGAPAGNYTLQASGAGKLHMAADSGSAAIEVQSGAHSVTAPLVLDSNTEVVVNDPAAGLALAGPVSGTGALTLGAGNAGKVSLGGANFTTGHSGGTTVNAGTLQLDSADALRGGSNLTLTGSGKAALGGATSVNLGSAVKLADLNLNAHATSGLTAALDLNKCKLIADKTQVPTATIRAQIKSAYAAGRWTGAGIGSASAAADYAANAGSAKTGVGYLDNGISPAQGGGKTTWQGRSVDSSSVLVRFTYYGDCNLDGSVNLADFGMLKQNFGTGTQWYQGDFDYSGTVNLADFGKLKQAFGSTPIAAEAAVPEPPALALLIAAAIAARALRCRRRR